MASVTSNNRAVGKNKVHFFIGQLSSILGSIRELLKWKRPPLREVLTSKTEEDVLQKYDLERYKAQSVIRSFISIR